MNIARNLERARLFYPRKTALLFEGRAYTYLELDEKVNRLANGLQALGIRRGDRVALFLPNIPAFVIAYFAVQKVGGIAVSINALLKSDEVKYIVNDDFMGYWLGPGRNDIFLSLRYTPGKGKRIGLFVGRMEKGEVGIETPYPDPLSSDWGALNGTIERMTLGGVDCSWPLGKGVSLWLRWQHLAVENREHQPMRDTNHWEYFMGLTIESPPLFLPLSLPGGSTG